MRILDVHVSVILHVHLINGVGVHGLNTQSCCRCHTFPCRQTLVQGWCIVAVYCPVELWGGVSWHQRLQPFCSSLSVFPESWNPAVWHLKAAEDTSRQWSVRACRCAQTVLSWHTGSRPLAKSRCPSAESCRHVQTSPAASPSPPFQFSHSK